MTGTDDRDDLFDDSVVHEPPSFISLPMAQAFIVLSVTLGVGLWWLPLADLRSAVQVIVFLSVIPPFVPLLWLGTGLAALVQWRRLRHAWIQQQK